VTTRSKEVVVKEKSRMSVEIQELMAKIEVLSSEKVSIRKVCEKLEITVSLSGLRFGEIYYLSSSGRCTSTQIN
jgi:hypothetical protein